MEITCEEKAANLESFTKPLEEKQQMFYSIFLFFLRLTSEVLIYLIHWKPTWPGEKTTGYGVKEILNSSFSIYSYDLSQILKLSKT